MTENKMGTEKIFKLLMTMSVPMMISMLVQAAYNLVDTIFVSQIDVDALTAVTLAFPAFSLMISFANGTGVGVNAVLSKYLGQRRQKKVNQTAMDGILLAIISGVVFMAVGLYFLDDFVLMQHANEETNAYLRQYLVVLFGFAISLFGQVMMERLLISTGKTRLSMVSQILGAVLNCILDPIMIWGFWGFPAMGVAGAALATVCSQFVAIFIGLCLNLKYNKEIQFRLRHYKPKWKVIKKIYKIGFPAIVSNALISFSQFMMNRILIPFDSAVAVLGAFIRIQGFVLLPVFGLNNAMVPIISYNFGARKVKRIEEVVYLGLKIATGCLVLFGILFTVFYKPLLQVFSATDEMIEIGRYAFRIMTISYLFLGINMILPSLFQALGHAAKTLFISFVHRIIVLIPVAMFLANFNRVSIIWWAYVIAECGTLTLCLIFYKQVYRKELKVRD